VIRRIIASTTAMLCSITSAECAPAPLIEDSGQMASGSIRAQRSAETDQSTAALALENGQSPSRSRYGTGICLSLQIDPRIWGPSADMDPREQFSGIFLTYFDLAFRKAKAAGRVASGLDISILSDPYQRVPLCRDRARSVYIDARYTVASDGSVHFRHRLLGSRFSRSSREKHVLDGSWQTRSARAAQWDPVIMEMTKDIERRSNEILEEMNIARTSN
jgi:hypothetical protein